MFQLLLLFFLAIPLFASTPSDPLFNQDGGPSEQVLALMDLRGLPHGGSWKSILETTQAIAHSDVVSWELPPLSGIDRETAFLLFKELGVFDPSVPSSDWYDFGVIHGGSAPIAIQRFEYLKHLWEEGVRFKTLVLLTGDRPLAPFEYHLLCEAPQNETEMMILLLHSLDLPIEWRTLPLTVIDAPAPAGSSRPNTADTLREWRSCAPLPGFEQFS